MVLPLGCFGIITKSPSVGGISPPLSDDALSAARMIFSGWQNFRHPKSRWSFKSEKLLRVLEAPAMLHGRIIGNVASFGWRRARSLAGIIGALGGSFGFGFFD